MSEFGVPGVDRLIEGEDRDDEPRDVAPREDCPLCDCKLRADTTCPNCEWEDDWLNYEAD